MLKLLQEADVVVCVGSGGVGKTTVAASIAVLGAQLGRRVLVLTVDPSRRLKTTLGLGDQGEITKIKDPSITGELWAGVIQPKQIFDDFVRRAAQKDELAEKILKNKLYIQLSTTLSGSQEFTAMEKLYSAYESKKYDLIILDTPPTKHAIDFLHAPEKLSVLFNEKISKWFRDPEGKDRGLISNLLHTGTRQVLKILESLTGSEFIHELGDFFFNIQSWQSKLQDRTAAVHRLLVGTKTHFCLVSSFDEAKLKEAEFFSREIKKGGYQLSSVIINKAYPKWLDPQLNAPSDQQRTGNTALHSLWNQMTDYYRQKDTCNRSFAAKMSSRCPVLKLPELEHDIADFQGVKEMADVIRQVGVQS